MTGAGPADGHGYLRELVANGLLVLGQVAHESRHIGPIEVLTTEKTSPSHRPAFRMGHKNIPLCPSGNSRVHLSNPRLHSTRRLIRPLGPPRDRQGFYSCNRIKRLLVGQRPRDQVFLLGCTGLLDGGGCPTLDAIAASASIERLAA